jgi:hypothetical protein
LLIQSASTLQPHCTLHFVAHEAPQSTSLSMPLWTPSVHEGTAHWVPVHTPLWQSAAFAQLLPSAHVAHEAPQSTSLSAPLWTPSVHDGTAQWVPVHTPLWQSAAFAQLLPSAHVVGHEPPQSASVSPPL